MKGRPGPIILAPKKMLRALPILCLAAAGAAAQDSPHAPAPAPSPATIAAAAVPVPLNGTIENGIYTSPTGGFKITIPVLASLGGVVEDTNRVVTFHDAYGIQISVGAFQHDATQKWQLSTRGIKDYLIYFYGTYVLPDFKRFCPGTTTESAGFSADFLDGALFTYVLLPGGSMVEQHATFGPPTTPPVAKRGNLLFVRNGYTFVISTELSERVTEGSHYKKTVQEEDQLLRDRLVGIVKKMEFVKPAPKAAIP